MTGNKIDSIDPTDEVLPPRSLVLFGLQHVLVMAASPITAVFLVSKALGFSDALTVSLISATFLICGLGTILQSFGPAGFGARLPFIMVPVALRSRSFWPSPSRPTCRRPSAR